ncbi:DsbA family protein [Phreatobacter stygius]|uniref:DsbA family protein n=1 Tax=Phreatobacter stygius TaxID=1940610 RepID=A0A4D7AV60_9HYPH|nr:DsbA family protein [Phreatobacter stygius]QCI62868.1 DsbA family protein [Phreatobacter stygius]
MTDPSAPDSLHVTYLFDPLCGWCYGAAPMVRQLAATPGITVELAPTGLFSGDGARPMDQGFAAYAWSNDQRIERLSGQRFTEAYRQKVLNAPALNARPQMFDSGPATLALTAVSLTAPDAERDALNAIQEARYVDGRDIVSPARLAEILREAGLDAAAGLIATPSDALVAANRARTNKARQMMAALGAQGVPTLVVTDASGRRMLRSNALFGGFDDLLAAIRAA